MSGEGDAKSKVLFDKYFHGHKCCLPPDRISSYQIKCSKFRKCIVNLISVQKDDARARDMYRSYEALCAEKYRQYKYYPFSIHPFSILRVVLESITALAIISANTILAVHFSMHPTDTCYYAILPLDIFYVFLIITNLFTGYVEGNTHRRTILDLKRIIWRYSKTWLLIDILSSSAMIHKIGCSDNVTLILVTESMKLLRLPTLFTYVNNVVTFLGAGIYLKAAAELFLALYSYIAWNIYFQFVTEYMIEGSFSPSDPRDCSWLTQSDMWNSTPYHKFFYSLERSVSMLRQSADLNLLDRKECNKLYLMTAWSIGKAIVFHCALRYMIVVSGSESARAKYLVMCEQVQSYMNQRKLPPRIKKKILKFYAIRFQSHFFVESRMLECVSGQLKEDIFMHKGQQLVASLDFLKNMPHPLLLQIGIRLRLIVFLAGDIIFKINTTGDCLYFIDKGTVAIYSESGKEVCHLEDGDFFGEIALVMKHKLRTASAVAVTNCELYRLDREDFETYIASYPIVYEDIRKLATTRLEMTSVLNEHHKTEMKMAQYYD